MALTLDNNIWSLGVNKPYQITWDCSDAASLSTADWLTSASNVVNGVTGTINNAASAQVAELDGSTGLVLTTKTGVRSLPGFGPSPAILFDIQESVGGSWDAERDIVFLQMKFNAAAVTFDGSGIAIAEGVPPVADAAFNFFGTANSNLIYHAESGTNYSINHTGLGSMITEIVLYPMGHLVMRMKEWSDPGFPDPGFENSLEIGGYIIGGTNSPIKNLAATKWISGTATWGPVVFHNSSGAATFTQTTTGWRAGKYIK